MLRKPLLAALIALLAAGPGSAWNRAGHMTMAAMAFDELLRDAPATVARVVAILQHHPQYESRWRPQIAAMALDEQQRFLFMLAARWPDDVRGDAAFDLDTLHSALHFKPLISAFQLKPRISAFNLNPQHKLHIK